MSRVSVYDLAYDNAQKAKRNALALLEKGDFRAAEEELRTITSIADEFAIVGDDLEDFADEMQERILDAEIERKRSGQSE